MKPDWEHILSAISDHGIGFVRSEHQIRIPYDYEGTDLPLFCSVDFINPECPSIGVINEYIMQEWELCCDENAWQDMLRTVLAMCQRPVAVAFPIRRVVWKYFRKNTPIVLRGSNDDSTTFYFGGSESDFEAANRAGAEVLVFNRTEPPPKMPGGFGDDYEW
jgi:hypothetical protein